MLNSIILILLNSDMAQFRPSTTLNKIFLFTLTLVLNLLFLTIKKFLLGALLKDGCHEFCFLGTFLIFQQERSEMVSVWTGLGGSPVNCVDGEVCPEIV